MRRGSRICLSIYVLLHYFRIPYSFYDILNYCNYLYSKIVFIYQYDYMIRCWSVIYWPVCLGGGMSLRENVCIKVTLKGAILFNILKG